MLFAFKRKIQYFFCLICDKLKVTNSPKRSVVEAKECMLCGNIKSIVMLESDNQGISLSSLNRALKGHFDCLQVI